MSSGNQRNSRNKGIKLAETYGEGGLVIAPIERGCLGEECRHGTQCFTDRHHLYFEKQTYIRHPSSRIAKAFCLDPFNIINVARCMHDEIHAEYAGVPVPKVDLMKAFIEEAELLRLLEVNLAGYADLRAVLDFDLPSSRSDWNEVARSRGTKFTKKLAVVAIDEVRETKETTSLKIANHITELQNRAATIEVLPQEVVKRSVRRMKRRLSEATHRPSIDLSLVA